MKNIVNILNSGNYSINLKNDFNNIEKINSYYPTFNNMRLLDKILISIDNKVNGSIILSGAYGTGKSYFTSVLLNILVSSNDTLSYKELIEKSKNVYEIKEGIEKFSKKKIIPIFIDDSYDSFSEGVFSGVKKAMKEYNLEIDIPSSFEIINKKLDLWKESYPEIYKKFEIDLNENNFFKEFEFKSKKAIDIFSKVYSKIFAGEKFNNSGEIKNITGLLTEVEKGIAENGYDGVIYVFDEFGRYLESNISNIDVKEVQDMAEYCNDENSSNFFVITHKDLFQYSRKLKSNIEKDEWEKVSGRFLKEHLLYEKENILKIIKNIIENKNYDRFRKNNKALEIKENLLKKLNKDIDEKKVTKEFYPFDVITANILPDLSQKLAQNERTLFAFICSDEEGGLRSIINRNDKNDKFITLDKLYDYFEKELRQLPVDSFEYKIYLTSKDLLKQVKGKNKIDKKIIKSIALIYINNNFDEVKPNLDSLRYIYGDENLNLDELEDNKILSFKKYQNYYKLVENVDFNLEDKIREVKEKRVGKFDYLSRLEKTMNLGVYYPLKYNDNRKITRYLGQYYLDISDLSKLDILNNNLVEDGRIIYLTNLENNPNYKEISKNLKENYKDIFIVGDYQEKLDLVDELKELEAISILENTEEIPLNNEIVKNEVELLKKDIKNILKIKLDKFFNKTLDFLNLTNTYLEEKYNKYIEINYELINKHNLTIPMRKSRIEILKKIENKIELGDDYFNETKAESSVARVLLKNTGLYEQDSNKKGYLDIIKLKDSIIEDIKYEKISLEKIYEKYCSNKSEYGIREGVFTFILGIILIENKDFITLSLSDENTEIMFSLDILDLMEKNPQKYTLSYYSITIVEIDYMNSLEELIKEYISLKEVKISNRILGGIKNYLLSQPRYITNIYLDRLKGLNRIFRGIFTVNNGRELILKDLLKIYKTDKYSEVISSFEKEMLMLEEYKIEFQNKIQKNVLDILTDNQGKDKESLIEIISLKEKRNELDNFILNLRNENMINILKEITKKIKGFSYENWRSLDDLNEFKESLILQVRKKEENSKGKEIVISFDNREESISIKSEETMLEKMLSSKLQATIKNMGMSLSTQEKRQVLAKILLNI